MDVYFELSGSFPSRFTPDLHPEVRPLYLVVELGHGVDGQGLDPRYEPVLDPHPPALELFVLLVDDVRAPGCVHVRRRAFRRRAF